VTGTVRADRWLALLTMTRLLGAALAVLLLLAHHVTDDDVPLAAAAIVWTALTLIAFRHPAVRGALAGRGG
jgi:hypothetical protein